MTIAAIGVALAWVLATCWRATRPAAAVPATPREHPTTIVVEAGDRDARAGNIARVLAQLEHRADLDPAHVAVVVRGRGEVIAGHALERLAGVLAQPDVGAVQPAIRAAETDSLLGQLQDMEWVGLAELHGRRGEAFGMLGAGPGAPTYRWSAVRALDPWPTGGADDVATAAALHASGWVTAFAPGIVVTRLPAASLRELLSARIAAVDGLLRTLRVVPTLVRRGRHRAARVLLAPVGLLLIGVALVVVLIAAVLDPERASDVLFGDRGTRVLAWYAVLFAPAWVAAFTYWTRHGSIGVGRSIALGHLFVVYSLHWIVAAWVALVRLPFRRAAMDAAPTGARKA